LETREYKNDFLDRCEARGEAKALLVVLQARDIELTSHQRETVTTCTDAGQLAEWISRAGTATSAGDVFND
jgi:hypothetical protein